MENECKSIFTSIKMLILGVEPSQRTYKDRMLTDTLYELVSGTFPLIII